MNIKEKFINFMAQLSEDKEEVKPVDTPAADSAPEENKPEGGAVEKDVEIDQRVSDLEVAVAEIKATIENFIAEQEAKDEEQAQENLEQEQPKEEEDKKEGESEEEQPKEEPEEKIDEEKEELKKKCEQLSAQLSAMESEIKALKELPSAKQEVKRSKWF